ncbi:hypothetical protein KCU91_g18057, partial [Aureobasidium melanogenum]
MHFNAIALTLGLAATLGAAVPVDASTDTNPRSDGIIFPPFPPPFPIRDHGNDPLDIAELPQPVQDYLKSKPTPKEGDQQHPPELPPQEGNGSIYMPHKVIPGHHSEYDFDHLTVNKTKAPEDLSPKDAGEAGVAEEKDEALSDDDE